MCTVSEAKAENRCLQTKHVREVSFIINEAGKVYKPLIEFVYLGVAVSADKKISVAISWRLQRDWAYFQ